MRLDFWRHSSHPSDMGCRLVVNEATRHSMVEVAFRIQRCDELQSSDQSSRVAAARTLDGAASVAANRKRSGATAAINGSSRRPSTSLGRVGESIPSKLRPRRACVRFLSRITIATFLRVCHSDVSKRVFPFKHASFVLQLYSSCSYRRGRNRKPIGPNRIAI